MADYGLFDRLKKLFSTDVIIRNVGGNQIKVADTNRIQSSGNLATNVLIDRYKRLWNSRIPISGISSGEGIMIYRKEVFTDYEAMESDSIIAAAMDIIADECTTKDEFGDTITIRSDNPKVQKILHNLFYDILNIEFNLWPWVRNLIKYGDFFMKLNIVEKYGIISVEPLSSYQIIREEGYDDKNELQTKFLLDPSNMGSRQFVMHTTSQKPFENYEIAHFRLLSDVNWLPYGKSLLEPARKVWKQLTLMEDALLLHRIMRAPEKRVFKIDVGNIPPNEIDAYMQQIIAQSKKVPYQDPNTGDYNLKFNMQNMIEDFYIPVRGGESGTSIDTTKGLEYAGIEDIEYLQRRLLAALRVPKAFLNFDDSLGSKATLAAEDIRFSKTIERIQRIIVSELHKIAIVHLYVQGITDSELLDFDISMTSPSTIYESEKINLWQAKVNLAKDMIDANLMSREWINKFIMNLTDDDFVEQKDKVLNDARYSYRIKQITEEGNDPIRTGKSFGTSHDIAALYKGGNNEIPDGYDETIPDKQKDTDDVKTSIDDKLGRPEKNGTYGTHENPMGYDPIGKKEFNRSAVSKISELLKNKFNNKEKGIIIESLREDTVKPEESIDMLDEDNLRDNVN